MPLKVNCPGCGRTLSVPESSAGKRGKCPNCGITLTIPVAPAEETEFLFDDPLPSSALAFLNPPKEPEREPEQSPIAALGLDSDSEDPSAPDSDPIAARFGLNSMRPTRPAPEPEPKVWEYKVLTQKDKWFSGKFDPEKLEAALNSYARQGWRMRGMATASVPGFGGNRDELIFVLER